MTRPQKTEDRPTMEAVLNFYGVEYRNHVLGWQTVLCPLHGESNPSFRVNVDLGAWKCQGCGASGGDAIALVVAKEQVGFKEALQLAEEIPGDRVSASQSSAPAAKRTGRYKYRSRRGR